MKKKYLLVIPIGMMILLILGIGGKKYMEKRALEKDYQQGVELIQEYVTDYLVKNYEGIEKIEWQGVGIEWRSSPIYGNSIMGNYVKSDVKLFVFQNTYIELHFLLSGETEYDDKLKRYTKRDILNPENIDSLIEMEIRNANKRFNDEDKLKLQKLQKNSKNLLNPDIVYNIDIYDLKY